MDTDSGRFVDDNQSQAWMKRIAVGEIIKIKDEELEVIEIGERTIKLKLLSFDERFARSLTDFTDAADIESRRHRARMLGGKG